MTVDEAIEESTAMTTGDWRDNCEDAADFAADAAAVMVVLRDEVQRLRIENDHNTATAIRVTGERDAANAELAVVNRYLRESMAGGDVLRAKVAELESLVLALSARLQVPTPRVNAYGCRPVEDVCMEHEAPLVCEHGCEDAEAHVDD